MSISSPVSSAVGGGTREMSVCVRSTTVSGEPAGAENSDLFRTKSWDEPSRAATGRLICTCSSNVCVFIASVVAIIYMTRVDQCNYYPR